MGARAPADLMSSKAAARSWAPSNSLEQTSTPRAWRRLSSIVKYRSVSRKRTIHIGLSGRYPVDQRAQPRRVPFSTEHFNHRSTAVFMTQRAQGVDQDVNWRTFRKTAVQNADTLFGRKTLCDERREN
jgi:hypothetical protein